MLRIHLHARLAAVVSAAVIGLLAGCKTLPSEATPSAVAPASPLGGPSAQTAPAVSEPLPPSAPVETPVLPPVMPKAEDPVPAPAPSASAPAPAITPVPAVDLRPATIIGSEESSTMLDNLTVYVSSVDGRTLSVGRDGWNTPLKLKAGPHRIGVAFTRGVFSARTELPLDAESGVAYRVRFATDAQIFGRNTYCEFWIEEISSTKRVIGPTRVPLQRSANGH